MIEKVGLIKNISLIKDYIIKKIKLIYNEHC